MDCTIGTSSNPDPEQAVCETTFGFKHPKLIIFFSPAAFFPVISKQLSGRFPKATVIGTTSHYMYRNEKVDTQTLLAIAFNSGIKCEGGVLEEIQRFPLKYAQRIEHAVKLLPSIKNCICLEFTSAYSMSEELVLATYDSVCSKYGIPVAGGTSGMSRQESAKTDSLSYVSYNGTVYQDASVFICLHNTGGRIEILKENIYLPTNQQFTATSVDIKNRIVREFDGKPATEFLARMLNCTVEQLPQKMTSHQVGRVVNNDIFITSFDRIKKDESISWSARIYNNTALQLLKPGNYATITDETINTIKASIPSPSFVFLIHCLGRTIFYEQESYLDEFNNKFSSAFSHIAGFSSLGEQLGKLHLNHTLLAIVFE